MKKLLLSILVLFVLLSSVALAHGDGPTVVLASDTEADQAVGQRLAEKLGAELVITGWGTFTDAVLAEIQLHAPEEVVIVGGLHAIPEMANTQLEAAGFEVERLAGKDRFETASLVAGRGWGAGSDSVVVVHGYDKESIQEAIAKAKEAGIPILFVTKNRVPESVRDRLLQLKSKRAEHIPSPETDEMEVEGKLKEAGIEEVERTEINKADRAKKAIENAREAIAKVVEVLPEEDDAHATAAHRLYTKALENLDNAVEAYEAETYGSAFGQAVAAKTHARNAHRLSKRIEAGNLKDEVQESRRELREEKAEDVKTRLQERRALVKERAVEKKLRRATRAEKDSASDDEEVVEEPGNQTSADSEPKDLEDVDNLDKEENLSDHVAANSTAKTRGY